MITAIVLAAGLSTRMGRFKPLLPFGPQTVIEHVLSRLRESALDEILVITGHEHGAVEQRLAAWPVRSVFNPRYATGEMLSSLQIGLQSASAEADAALIALGDQPALQPSVVAKIVAALGRGQGSIIAPSYQRRRGHPMLIGREHWADILALADGQTLRDFFRGVGGSVVHVEVDTPTVMRDMDTPDDYRRELADFLSARQILSDVKEV